jgi:hypothetical protein
MLIIRIHVICVSHLILHDKIAVIIYDEGTNYEAM